MGNKLSYEAYIGTIGELLVQLRLLQYEVQAAPPIKDSGNDLIAIRGEVVKFIQVKTSTKERINTVGLPNIYHMLALVKLKCDRKNIFLDQSDVFFITKKNVKQTSYLFSKLGSKIISEKLINEIF